jgi:hypothetical protein
MAAGGLPDLLTVEEAAVLLRIGRNKAYSLARQWRATNGRCGLPVVEFGHTLRVPLHALEQMLGVKFTAWPAASVPAEVLSTPDEASRPRSGSVVTQTPADPAQNDVMDVAGPSDVIPIRHRRRTGSADQLPLFRPAGPIVESP